MIRITFTGVRPVPLVTDGAEAPSRGHRCAPRPNPHPLDRRGTRGGWEVCGKLWHPLGFWEACFGLWQTYGFKVVSQRFLTPGTGDEGCGGALGAVIMAAMGETKILAAEGMGAAGPAGLGPVGAGARNVGDGCVSCAEALAGSGADGAALALVDGGAVASHCVPPRGSG